MKALMILICLFAAIMLAKNEETHKQQTKIIDAIARYQLQLIVERRLEECQVDFDDMEHYDETFRRFWDWGPTRILPPEKYEIIKPYMEGSHET